MQSTRHPINVSDVNVRRMLHGNQRYRNLVVKTYRIRRPFIEVKKASCVIRLQDKNTNELIAGKLLLSAHDGVRDFTSRQKRHASLKQWAMRSLKFAPEGVAIGLRPIIMASGDYIYCGAIADGTKLDPRFEYIWCMHLFKGGESIDDKVHRNVALLQPLAYAIQDLHSRADAVSVEEAWNYASPVRLRQKLLRNIAWFEQSLPNLQRSVTAEEWNMLWPDQCARQLRDISEAIFKSDVFRRAFDRRIETGKIRRGHGDIKAKNIWFSDYHRLGPVREFKDCLTFFDPVDFDDTFSTIDTLSEAAYLMVDLQRKLAPVDYAHFLYYYVAGEQSWHIYDELLLNYYMVDKALVGASVELLFDNNLVVGRQYLWNLRIHLQKLLDQIDRLRAVAIA